MSQICFGAFHATGKFHLLILFRGAQELGAVCLKSRVPACCRIIKGYRSHYESINVECDEKKR